MHQEASEFVKVDSEMSACTRKLLNSPDIVKRHT